MCLKYVVALVLLCSAVAREEPLPSGTVAALQFSSAGLYLTKINALRAPVQPVNATAQWACGCNNLGITATMYTNNTLYLVLQGNSDSDSTLVTIPDPTFEAPPAVVWQPLSLGYPCNWVPHLPVALTRDSTGFLVLWWGQGDDHATTQWRLHHHIFANNKTERSEPLSNVLGPLPYEQLPFAIAPHPTLANAVVLMKMNQVIPISTVLYVLSVPTGKLLSQHVVDGPRASLLYSDFVLLHGNLYMFAADSGVVLFPVRDAKVNSTVTVQAFPSSPPLAPEMQLARETRGLWADEARGLLVTLAAPLATPTRPPPYTGHGIFFYNTTGATVFANPWDFVSFDGSWPLGRATWYVPKS